MLEELVGDGGVLVVMDEIAGGRLLLAVTVASEIPMDEGVELVEVIEVRIVVGTVE